MSACMYTVLFKTHPQMRLKKFIIAISFAILIGLVASCTKQLDYNYNDPEVKLFLNTINENDPYSEAGKLKKEYLFYISLIPKKDSQYYSSATVALYQKQLNEYLIKLRELKAKDDDSRQLKIAADVSLERNKAKVELDIIDHIRKNGGDANSIKNRIRFAAEALSSLNLKLIKLNPGKLPNSYEINAIEHSLKDIDNLISYSKSNLIEAENAYLSMRSLGTELAQLIENRKEIYSNELIERTRSVTEKYFSASEKADRALCSLAKLLYGFPFEIKDDLMALNLFLLALNLDSDSEFIMGCIYRDGKAVPSDINTALKWWRKSAKNGNKNADSALYKFSNNQ